MKVYCCGERLESNFCPNCGMTMEEATKKNETPFPKTFTTYVHGDKEYELADELKIERNSELYFKVVGCAYEVELNWELTEYDELNLVKVDGKHVISKEDYDLLQEIKNK